MLAVALVGCAPAGPNASVSPAVESPRQEPDALPEHRVDESPMADLTAIASRTAPGAQVVMISREAGRDWATIRWRSVRLRIEYVERRGVEVNAHRALEAASFLEELAGAGVVLARTSASLFTERGEALACGADYDDADDGTDAPRYACRAPATRAADESPAEVSLAPLDYMRPPSRRSRGPDVRRPPGRSTRGAPLSSAAALRVAEVYRRHPDLELSGVVLDGTHHALLVTEELGLARLGVLICVAASGVVDCAPTDLDLVEGGLATSSPGWRVVARNVDGARSLVALTRVEGGLVVDALQLGGVDAEGYPCEERPGRCVGVRGTHRDARLLSATCVELGPATQWSATHVRIGDRWVDELIEPGPDCVERHLLREGRFERSDCGPAPAAMPLCPTSAASPP